MIQPEVQEILIELSVRYNKPIHVIEEIFMSQWKFLKNRISCNDIQKDQFKTIKFPKWGKYSLAKRKLDWIRKHNPEGKVKHGTGNNGSEDKVDTSTDRNNGQ